MSIDRFELVRASFAKKATPGEIPGKKASEYLKKNITDEDIDILANSFNFQLGARPAQTEVREYVDSILQKILYSSDSA